MGIIEDILNNKNAGVTVSYRNSPHNPLNQYLSSAVSTLGLTATCGTDTQRGALLQQMIQQGLNASWPVIVLYTGETTGTAIRNLFPHITTPRGFKAMVRPASGCTYNPLYRMPPVTAKQTIVEATGQHADSLATALLEHLLELIEALQYPIHLGSLIWMVNHPYSTVEALIRSNRLPASFLYLDGTPLQSYYVSDGHSTSPHNTVRGMVHQFRDLMQDQLWSRTKTTTTSILEAIHTRGFLAIELQGTAEDSAVIRYLAKELNYACTLGIPFLLALCDVITPQRSSLATTLYNNKGRFRLFVSARDMLTCFPGEAFWKSVFDLTDQLLVLQCSTPGSSKTYSELFGSYVRQIEINTHGVHRGPFDFFSGHSRSSHIEEKDFPRITEEQLRLYANGGAFWRIANPNLQICHNIGIPNTMQLAISP